MKRGSADNSNDSDVVGQIYMKKKIRFMGGYQVYTIRVTDSLGFMIAGQSVKSLQENRFKRSCSMVWKGNLHG